MSYEIGQQYVSRIKEGLSYMLVNSFGGRYLVWVQDDDGGHVSVFTAEAWHSIKNHCQLEDEAWTDELCKPINHMRKQL